jgi:hypothetical protein
MAITINDQPYQWAVRGQKLMIIATSTETAQNGFRYGLTVTINLKVYNFYITPYIDDKLYFDLNSLVNTLRNDEPLNYHMETDDTYDDQSKLNVSFSIAEYWMVAGVLTENEGSSVNGDPLLVVNGYFQVVDGYKPNVQTGTSKVKYSLTNTSSFVMSDRTLTTTPLPKLASTWGVGSSSIWIPVFETDYGVLNIPGNAAYLGNNTVTDVKIQIFSSTGVPTSISLPLNGYDIEALPVYPANLNDWTGLTVKPSLFPDWRFYQVVIQNGVNNVSRVYSFYNAAAYGQSDCWWDKIRLGWVNSRGGWDYFNFTKKSETTDEIERKKIRKVLFNGSVSIFNQNDRGLEDRRNIVQQVMTVTSDYISEGEFILLRSLLVSNQVTWITQDAGKYVAIPVNLDDTNYVEKKTRDGKLYNVTLKVRIANEYWT